MPRLVSDWAWSWPNPAIADVEERNEQPKLVQLPQRRAVEPHAAALGRSDEIPGIQRVVLREGPRQRRDANRRCRDDCCGLIRHVVILAWNSAPHVQDSWSWARGPAQADAWRLAREVTTFCGHRWGLAVTASSDTTQVVNADSWVSRTGQLPALLSKAPPTRPTLCRFR